MKYHTGAMCSGVDDGLAGSKFGASMNRPPKVGTKNTTMANSGEEQADADDVLERVVRMERDAVLRLAVRAQVFLDLDAIRIVRAHLAQGDQVQER